MPSCGRGAAERRGRGKELMITDTGLPIPSRFSGGCACGAVRYECAAAPVAMVNCHCRDCQRAGGSGYSPTVIVHRSAFTLTADEPVHLSVTGESANIARRAFCGHCGSPLYPSTSARPGFVGIRAASLD